jgi:hypothetical protein
MTVVRQVALVASLLCATAAAADAGTQQSLVKFTKWLVIVGTIQFVALIAQALVFVLTLLVMRGNGQKQLRAYVCVDKALLKLEPPDRPEAQIHFKNGGQTPAYDMRQWGNIWIEESPLKIELPAPTDGFQASVSILPPGGESIMIVPKKLPVPPEAVHLIGTLAGTVYVYGELRYRDAFGKQRFTKYRLKYGDENGGRRTLDSKGVRIGFFQPEREGNDAT